MFSPRNVYWTDTVKSAILVARHDGNYKKTLLMENGFKPTAILVDPEVGLVFCFFVIHINIITCASANLFI